MSSTEEKRKIEIIQCKMLGLVYKDSFELMFGMEPPKINKTPRSCVQSRISGAKLNGNNLL